MVYLRWSCLFQSFTISWLCQRSQLNVVLVLLNRAYSYIVERNCGERYRLLWVYSTFTLREACKSIFKLK